MSYSPSKVREELRVWFFEGYLPHGTKLINGEDPAGAKGFLKYWGRPLLTNQDGDVAWKMTDEEVLEVVEAMNRPLVAAGYRKTPIPDYRIVAYNENGGAIEVIWSRQDGEGKEIQRLAVHFELARIDGTWRYTSIQARTTERPKDEDSLEMAWAV
jgi:hypothetical protein